VLESLSVSDWQSEYRQSSHSGFVTLDGPCWRFILRDGSLHVASGGRMAYPSINPPHGSTPSPAALRILRAALDQLVEGRSALVEAWDHDEEDEEK
jgi:hypothetical protein